MSLQPFYKIEGSYGKGKWTGVPWIAVFDTRITSSAQKGVYIVYLFNKDSKEAYLTLATAATEVLNSTPKHKSNGSVVFEGMVGKISEADAAKLNDHVNLIRKKLNLLNFSRDSLIDSGAPAYDRGAICYKKYSLKTMPSEDVLKKDLEEMLEIYSQYHQIQTDLKTAVKNDVLIPRENEQNESELEMPENRELTKGLSIEEDITSISSFISSKGFTFDPSVIKNFYLSLKSKPFVILAGISGTGKTKLVELFAEAINAKYKLVPVRPDWSDSSDLFGHCDLNGKFVDGAIIQYLKEANEHPDVSYILCLDEMNLARVEYYMSDFLSIIETRKLKDGKIVTEPLITKGLFGSDDAAYEKYGEIMFPENLYVVGTVNMDETTFPFSKKVLDRANTIEFSYVDLNPKFEGVNGEVESLNLPNSFLRSNYTILADCKDHEEKVSEYCEVLKGINEILRTANLQVGYRVRDEIVFYMLNNEEGKLLLEEEAMDYEILQKILPRIQGSSETINRMMKELFKVFAGDYKTLSGDQDSDKMRKYLNDGMTAKYKLSAEKIVQMVKRFEEDGFTSYWF